MLITGVSDNVGGVKRVATTLPHALEQERHFALIGEVLNPTKARFLISIQVGNSVRPMHLFGHKFDHDYYFELLREEERAAHSITRCFTAHHRLFRAGPRANRTF
jgi:hypothetical protein